MVTSLDCPFSLASLLIFASLALASFFIDVFGLLDLGRFVATFPFELCSVMIGFCSSGDTVGFSSGAFSLVDASPFGVVRTSDDF